MHRLRLALLTLLVLLASALPAAADSTLFTQWDRDLLCPHGWDVEVDEVAATLRPHDASAYPGNPVVMLFREDYEFPYLHGPEDGATAAFEHLMSSYFVEHRQPAVTQVIDEESNFQFILVEGTIRNGRPDAVDARQYVAVMLVLVPEDAAQYFMMASGNTEDALSWAAYVAGTAVSGMQQPLTADSVASFRLPDSPTDAS